MEDPATPDNPGASGNWDGYFDRRTSALRPLAEERASVDAEVRRLEAGGTDYAGYRDALTRRDILDTNMATTTPDFLSPDGQFRPGDLEGFARERSIGAMQTGRESNGRPRLPAEEANAAYDAQLAAMTPDQRAAHFRDAENEYRAMRAGEVSEASLRARFPGALGAALATASAMGLIGGPVGGCRSCRGHRLANAPTARDPNAPSASGNDRHAAARAEAAARIDPGLRARIDRLRPNEPLPLRPGGKDGVLDYLRHMPVEYGVFRNPQGGMYVITQHERGSVRGIAPDDRIIFHNHPSGAWFLSGTPTAASAPPGWAFRYRSGDQAVFQQLRPGQLSTVLGTPGTEGMAGRLSTRDPFAGLPRHMPIEEAQAIIRRRDQQR